jgi:hypothetical protein
LPPATTRGYAQLGFQENAPCRPNNVRYEMKIMIKKWFKRKMNDAGLVGHRIQIREYLTELSGLDDAEIAQTVAFGAMIRRQILKQDPSFDKLANEGYSCDRKRLVHNTLVLGNLVKQAKKENKIPELAGLLVWLQTFRCLAHPELLEEGKEMWSHLKRGVDSIEEGFSTLHHEGVFSALVVDEVRKYADYIPSVYASE